MNPWLVGRDLCLTERTPAGQSVRLLVPPAGTTKSPGACLIVGAGALSSCFSVSPGSIE